VHPPPPPEERFDALFAAHRLALLSYAVRRVGDPQDAADVVADTFLVAWRRLGDVPPGFQPVENPVTELEDSPDLPSLRDVFGIRRRADGAVEIEKVTPALASPHAALHLGPINFLLEAAAMDALERATGKRDQQVEHWSVMMVKPGFTGPFVARAAVVPGRDGRFGVEATLVDEGAKGRVMATAAAAYRRVGAR